MWLARKDLHPFLYDASFSSSHGDSSCASCHVFGDLDSLPWDLGNPDAVAQANPGPFIRESPIPTDFLPMKGPTATQSLRGMANHGPMHWRGDRNGGLDAPSAQPDSGTFDEVAAFKKFTIGFTNLLGRDVPPTEQEMQAFADFILQVSYPPNPIRALDNSLTPDQQAGRDFFLGPISDVDNSCHGCHTLDPGANPTSSAPGFFGTRGMITFEGLSQLFKVPHLRNMYQKIGMFGMAEVPGIDTGDTSHTGDQVRGIGFLHDGSIDTLVRFLRLDFTQSEQNPDGFPPQ